MNRLEQLGNEVREAIKKEQIIEQIEICERSGYYFLAGFTAKEAGLFKRAYENFKKIEDVKSINKLNKIIFPEHYLTTKKIQRTDEIYKEKDKYENWDKKVNDDLVEQLKRVQTKKGNFLPYLIKISN